MNHNFNTPHIPEPDDESGVFGEQNVESEPYGADMVTDVPSKAGIETNIDGNECLPHLATDDSPRWDVPSTTFIDPSGF